MTWATVVLALSIFKALFRFWKGIRLSFAEYVLDACLGMGIYAALLVALWDDAQLSLALIVCILLNIWTIMNSVNLNGNIRNIKK